MLTPEQTQSWQSDGFVVLPGFKTATELSPAIARAHALVDAFDPSLGAGRFSTRHRSLVADERLLASAEAVHCFFEEEALDDAGRLTVPKSQSINKIGHALHDLDPVFDAFSHGTALAELARDIGLGQPLLWQSMLIFKQPHIGGEVGWHQDASFFATDPSTVTTFWFALEDATLENGCLWVAPGGHRGPLRERYVCEQGKLRMEGLDSTPWPGNDRARALPVAAGSLVVFHGHLPHYSAANRSARSRLAYTLHVTDASARYAPQNWLQRSAALPVRGFVASAPPAASAWQDEVGPLLHRVSSSSVSTFNTMTSTHRSGPLQPSPLPGQGAPIDVGPPSAHPLARLHDPRTVRLRCASILRSVEAGLSPYFSVDREQLPALAERVAALTLRRFPDLRIPLHSRWRHFEAGGVDRKAELDALLAGRSPQDQARARFDLTVVSVLLDAGAGANWSYAEGRSLQAAALPQAPADELLAMLDRSARSAPTPSPEPSPSSEPTPEAATTERFYTRSEGLGVASFRAFLAGAFSGHPGDPLRADAATLRHVDAAALRALFQSSPVNPVVGLEGRAALLSRLGAALHDEGQRSGHDARPALILERLTVGGTRHTISATELLGEVLRCLSPIWPSGSRVQGLPAGDVWQHRWAGSDVGGTDGAAAGAISDRTTAGWVPLHKLSQWLSYSLVEPLQWAGVQVTELDALTGLSDYRNGGLLIDSGVLVLRDPRLQQRSWKPQDELIIEWRALTVTLLDELAQQVRERLGRSAQELPLACLLEGGTWAAGREIAKELRSDGAPPLQIDSDGTLI